MTPQFGARVVFDHYLVRQSNGGNFREIPREWAAAPIDPTEGIIIGTRTLTNGAIENLPTRSGYDIDVVPTYVPREHFRAYVVAFDMHRKPFYVLPEHTKPEENR